MKLYFVLTVASMLIVAAVFIWLLLTNIWCAAGMFFLIVGMWYFATKNAVVCPEDDFDF